MNTKRLRMFAGPNGSGKSTVFYEIRSKFNLGIYLNAALVFDNSEDKSKIILDIYNGNEVTYRTTKIPLWVDEYLLNR